MSTLSRSLGLLRSSGHPTSSTVAFETRSADAASMFQGVEAVPLVGNQGAGISGRNAEPAQHLPPEPKRDFELRLHDLVDTAIFQCAHR